MHETFSTERNPPKVIAKLDKSTMNEMKDKIK